MRIDFVKPPLSFEDQLSLLSDRGLLIIDQEEALETIKSVNYYRLRGYYIHLYDSNSERFIQGTTLHKIRMIHDFDIHLLHLTAKYLMRIEIAFKTQIAYCHAHNYGGLGYLHPDNFKSRQAHDAFYSICMSAIVDSRDVFSKHFKTKYNGNFPVWSAVELLSMTCISKMYSNMLDKDAAFIAKEFYKSTSFIPVKANIFCLSVLRNICAHGGRIYGRKLPFKTSLSKKDKQYFEENQNDTYFAAMFAMKYLSPSSLEWEQYIQDLEFLLLKYQEFIDYSLLDLRDDWKNIMLSRSSSVVSKK